MADRIFPQKPASSGLGILVKALLGLVLVFSLTACVAQFRNHGYVPSDAQLAQIDVGVDTKETLAEEIGAPGTEGILDGAAWYYVRSQFRHLGAFEPKEVDRQVVAISFDARGRVSNIERFGLEQGRVVVLSRRVTDGGVQGITFLQQLFGNLGNVSAEQLLQ
ncbi:MAG: outer membrane protein assembly factor BamE [Rhodobacteraceae bacterium]|uniref:outer membrane protein assembly factor BamE n=1 Tax=Celeribacter sp. HF31 TaxID=2721558 RepID=UPI001430776B|nr:outer membrane protein assembly factor BamE [Celeribacter sp. HF31]NIY78675.1 outer membrane protein assembly factor BamE [Celeribacter sp. HF31]NVK47710.1 outer membrane protein assembly factor BamE [Paracoccaceae bacterium]